MQNNSKHTEASFFADSDVFVRFTSRSGVKNAQTGDFGAEDNIQTDYFTPCAYTQGKKTLLVTFLDRTKRIEHIQDRFSLISTDRFNMLTSCSDA